MNEKESPNIAESKDSQLSFNLQICEKNKEDIKLSYKDIYFFNAYKKYYRKNIKTELTKLKDTLKKYENKYLNNSNSVMEDFVFYPPMYQIKPVEGTEHDQAEVNRVHKYMQDQRFVERLVDYIELYAEKFKNKDSFHNLLIKYFSESGLSQKELSERANVNYTTLNKVLNKKKNIDNISMNYILKLCLAMNLDIDETQKLLLFSGYVLTGKDDREIYLRTAIKNKLGVVKTNLYLDENNLQLL